MFGDWIVGLIPYAIILAKIIEMFGNNKNETVLSRLCS